MKLEFLPTLSEIRGMLGDDLYVKFVWMWREQEQNTRQVERRAKLGDAIPQRPVEAWPTPVFARLSDQVAPSPAQAFQAALLRAPRLADNIDVSELGGFLDRVGAKGREEPREAAMGGRRRRG
ncbi:MAG TPA: hypothetical protein VII49_08740 [Rhizomicrobium sp.]